MLIGQTHNRTKFRHPLTRSVRDIRCRKFVLHKSGPKFTKIGDDLLRTNTPYRVKFHRAPPTMHKKSVTKLYTLHYFGTLGDPLGQSSPIWVVIYSKLSNFFPFWKPLYEIFAAKVRRFCSRRDRHMTWHGEDGLRPQWPLYPRNNFFIMQLCQYIK